MADKSGFLPQEVYDYLLAISSREQGVLKSLRQETMQLPGAQMAIPPEQAQLLQFLVKLIKAKRVIELGMFTGYSALAMALALPTEGELITCELTPIYLDLAQRYWKQAEVEKKIAVRVGSAIDSLESLLQQGGESQFDLAFIDADKQGYDAYYEYCLRLVRSGGIIAIDNTLWCGRLVQVDDGTEATKVLRELNEKIHYDKRIDLVTLAIGGGLTLARKL